MDIDGAALQAISASLKEQAGRVGAPVQQHANLNSALLQSATVGYVNGQEWGFHDVDQLLDIPYSVSHNTPNGQLFVCGMLHQVFVTGHVYIPNRAC